MEQLRTWLADLLSRLASVTAVPVGRPNDGLVQRGGTLIDKPWGELRQEFDDSLDAWRKNPLARRLVGLITSYVVGNGISLQSQEKELQTFIQDFWAHNGMDQRLDEWSDELARTGELFPVLFTNPVSGISTLRVVPASRIEEIDISPDDYEAERAYREYHFSGDEPKTWIGPDHAQATDPLQPLMLHYAVNRPIGGIRGESDLAPILPWLRRYSRWLEDRVRLNAAMRAFLWIVHAPARLRPTLEERYRIPPEPGSIVIAEQDAETWEAVSPNLRAADAEKDGRAIRWMIAAGGPGTSLLDLGEGEDSNLATGQAMAEMRRRFLRRRQSYFVWLLTDLVIHAWTRYAAVTGKQTQYSHAQISAQTPDISPEDNQALATAASALTSSLAQLAQLTGSGPTYRRIALRLFARFIGEPITDEEAQAILTENPPQPQNAQPNRSEEDRARNTHHVNGVIYG